MIEAPSFALPHAEFAAPSGPLLRRSLAPARAGWRDDLRFFGTAYLLALVFFLLLIV